MDATDQGYCTVEVLLDASGHTRDYVFLATNPASNWVTGLTGVVGKNMRELILDVEEHQQHKSGQTAHIPAATPPRANDG